MNAATLYRDGEYFAELTTESPSSSYGMPVLRLHSPIVGGDFGPADLVPWGCFPGPNQRGGETPIPAAFIVEGWALDPRRNADERALAARFLHQWPEGPQPTEAGAFLYCGSDGMELYSAPKKPDEPAPVPVVLLETPQGRLSLTTDSALSSYGRPVLRIESEALSGDLGPADLIPVDPIPADGSAPDMPIVAAGALVASWSEQPGRTPAEIEAAAAFCAQWPTGPQPDGGEVTP